MGLLLVAAVAVSANNHFLSDKFIKMLQSEDSTWEVCGLTMFVFFSYPIKGIF